MITLPIWAFIGLLICDVPTLLILITALVAIVYKLASKKNYDELEDNDCPYKVEASNEDYKN